MQLVGAPRGQGNREVAKCRGSSGGRQFLILGGPDSLCLASALTGRAACSASNTEAFWTVLAEEGGGIRQFILTFFCVRFSSFQVYYFLQ